MVNIQWANSQRREYREGKHMTELRISESVKESLSQLFFTLDDLDISQGEEMSDPE